MKITTPISIRLAVCLLSGLVSANPAHGQNRPDFEEILAKFITKAETDSTYIGENYIHLERETTRTLEHGVVSRVEEKLFQVEQGGRELYKKLIEKDGLPVRGHNFQKKDELISIGINLFGRYDFTYSRNEIFEGLNCWVFSFKPKDNLIITDEKDNALNSMVGEIWIEKNGLAFKKIEARLLQEADLSIIRGFGNIRLHRLQCTAIAQTIEDRFAFRYARADYVYTAKLFWVIKAIDARHEIKEVSYENYKRGQK